MTYTSQRTTAMSPTIPRNPLSPKPASRRDRQVRPKQRPSAVRQPVGSKPHNQHSRPERAPGSVTETDPFISNPKVDQPPTRNMFNGIPSPPITPPRPLPESRRSAPAVLQHGLTGDAGGGSEEESSVSELDSKIAKALESTLTTEQLEKKNKLGYVYLFKVKLENEPEKIVRKVGYTENTVEARFKDIKAKCRHPSMNQEQDSEDRPIILSHRAEGLVKAELSSLGYKFPCSCGTPHTEYFDVGKAAALEVIGRWRTFCEMDPYNAHGKLLPFWEHRLKHHKNGRTKFYDSHQNLTEAELLQIRWKWFSSVSKRQMFIFDIAHDSANVWPVVALVEALAFASLTPFPLFIAIMAVVFMVSIFIWKNEWKFPGLSAWVMDWTSWF